MSPALPDVLPSRLAGLEVSEFDIEQVVFDPRCNEVHVVAGAAAVVFDACDGSTPTAELIAEFGEAGIDGELAADAVRAALDELGSVGLLTGSAERSLPP